MYGKIFESLYEGSMIGAGSPTFAVWGYVIANMKPDKVVGAQVDLNPKLLAFVLGDTEEVVSGVIQRLCDPDLKSRTKDEDGRRLIKLGEYTYKVVNGMRYRQIREASERREYFRDYRRRKRESNNGIGAAAGTPTTTTRAAFSKPSIEEVKLDGAKIGLPDVECEKFWNYYESKGWVVGKSQMKSWHGALSGWKLRWMDNGNSESKPRRDPNRPGVMCDGMTEQEILDAATQ